MKNNRYITIERDCVFCSKYFSKEIYKSAANRVLYCGEKCRHDAYLKRKGKNRFSPRDPRECKNPNCNKVFVPGGFGNKGRCDIVYCSIECRVSVRNKKSNKKRPLRSNKPYLKLRFIVLSRDGFTCQYCGRKSPEVVLEVDHIKPKRLFSKEEERNPDMYLTACHECNLGKSDVLLDLRKLRHLSEGRKIL